MRTSRTMILRALALLLVACAMLPMGSALAATAGKTYGNDLAGYLDLGPAWHDFEDVGLTQEQKDVMSTYFGFTQAMNIETGVVLTMQCIPREYTAELDDANKRLSLCLNVAQESYAALLDNPKDHWDAYTRQDGTPVLSYVLYNENSDGSRSNLLLAYAFDCGDGLCRMVIFENVPYAQEHVAPLEPLANTLYWNRSK